MIEAASELSFMLTTRH